jgi:hypothetical protein
VIYLNQCPECKSKRVSIKKNLRFRKTMWGVLLLSFLFVLGYLDDANRLGQLQKSESNSTYIGLIMSGEGRLSNEMTSFFLITIVLWIVAVGLFSIKKVVYHCEDCNLEWRSQ